MTASTVTTRHWAEIAEVPKIRARWYFFIFMTACRHNAYHVEMLSKCVNEEQKSNKMFQNHRYSVIEKSELISKVIFNYHLRFRS